MKLSNSLLEFGGRVLLGGVVFVISFLLGTSFANYYYSALLPKDTEIAVLEARLRILAGEVAGAQDSK